MRWLSVKNWAEFQHYADRNPTWIKLHRSLLDDYEFCALPDHAKSHLMLIWLFASQSHGLVPADPSFLTRKLGLNRPLDLDQLIASGFLIAEPEIAGGNQPASDALALVDKRREQKPKSKRTAFPQDFTITQELRDWANANGYDHLEASLAYLRDYATANAKLYADWNAAFRNCVKGDWGKARERARASRKPDGPKVELPRCIEPGCTSDGAPIWGGRCQVHHAQRKPLTPAQAQAGIVRAA